MKAPAVRLIAEVTLVLVLFIDASTVNLQSLIRERGLPFRLLFIGLPLTMVLGFFLAIPIFSGMSLWVIALMAFILSPTDAALGQPVVTSPLVPEKIKEAINVESGLNDGIALPPILACIAELSAETANKAGFQYWIGFTLKQFLFGPILGALVGWLGGILGKSLFHVIVTQPRRRESRTLCFKRQWIPYYYLGNDKKRDLCRTTLNVKSAEAFKKGQD